MILSFFFSQPHSQTVLKWKSFFMEKVHNKTADCKLVCGTWMGTWWSLVVSALLGKESKKLGTYLFMLSCSVSETPGTGSSGYGSSQTRITGVGCHLLLQGIFPTQGSNLSFLHWQAGSLPLNHLGSPNGNIATSLKIVTVLPNPSAAWVCFPCA